MNDLYDWDSFPRATHCTEDGHCYYFKDDEGVWQLDDEDGDYCRSVSLYNGETDPETLIAKEIV